MLIFPKYYGESNIIVRTVGDSAFEYNTSISSVYLNEGMTTLETDAFKNCTSLSKVYFSDTVTSVAKDAFYYSEDALGTSFENDRRPYAVAMRFYRSNWSSGLSHSEWLACKWRSREKLYGEKYSTFGSIDLRNAFQTYSGSYKDLVHNLF